MQTNWKRYLPGCVAGNIIELYEFVIYGSFAKTITDLFFPPNHQYNHLLIAFSIFATGSMCRPFSAVWLGYVGDRFGRRKALIFSVAIMALATLSIGILPTYSTIGIFAPILLISLRLLQGLSMTGEEVAAALFLMEQSPRNDKAYASSFALSSVYLGLLLGSIISFFLFATLNRENLLLYGWRIPFIIGGILGLITLTIRIRHPESYEFKIAVEKNNLTQNPIINLFKYQKLMILKMTCVCSSFAVAVYLFAIYIPNMLNMHLHQYLILLICSSGYIFTFLTSMGIGKLTDIVGGLIPLMIANIGFLVFSYLIFTLLSSQSWLSISLGYISFAILLGCAAGALMYTILNHFPFHTRFSGGCIVFNLSMSFFGGTAPLFALYFTKVTTLSAAPALLLMLTSLMSLVSLFYLKRS